MQKQVIKAVASSRVLTGKSCFGKQNFIDLLHKKDLKRIISSYNYFEYLFAYN